MKYSIRKFSLILFFILANFSFKIYSAFDFGSIHNEFLDTKITSKICMDNRFAANELYNILAVGEDDSLTKLRFMNNFAVFLEWREFTNNRDAAWAIIITKEKLKNLGLGCFVENRKIWTKLFKSFREKMGINEIFLGNLDLYVQFLETGIAFWELAEESIYD